MTDDQTTPADEPGNVEELERRLQEGTIEVATVEAAAYCGSPAAIALTGQPDTPEDLDTWSASFPPRFEWLAIKAVASIGRLAARDKGVLTRGPRGESLQGALRWATRWGASPGDLLAAIGRALLRHPHTESE